MGQMTAIRTIWDVLAIYRDMDKAGILDMMVEPPISVIEDDLDLAVESYQMRRTWTI